MKSATYAADYASVHDGFTSAIAGSLTESTAFWKLAAAALAPGPEPRPVVICEPTSGLSNRLLAIASTIFLALVAGAEVRLSPRACADLSPGGPFDTPAELRVLLGCGQSIGCFQHQFSPSSSSSPSLVPPTTSLQTITERTESAVKEEVLLGATLSQRQRQLRNHDHSRPRRSRNLRQGTGLEEYMSAMEVNKTEALVRLMPSLALSSPQHISSLLALKWWNPLGPPSPPPPGKKHSFGLSLPPNSVTSDMRTDTPKNDGIGSHSSSHSSSSHSSNSLPSTERHRQRSASTSSPRHPLLALHGSAHLGLRVLSNQWFAPMLYDKPMLGWNLARHGASSALLERLSQTSQRGKYNDSVAHLPTLGDFFHAVAEISKPEKSEKVDESASIAPLPSLDPFALVAGLLFRPNTAIKEIAATVAAKYLPRPILTMHLRVGVLAWDLNQGARSFRGLRNHVPTEMKFLSLSEQGRELDPEVAEYARRLKLIEKCAAKSMLAIAKELDEEEPKKEELPGPITRGQVFIAGDSESNVEALADALRSALANRSSSTAAPDHSSSPSSSKQPRIQANITVWTNHQLLAPYYKSLEDDARICGEGGGRGGGSSGGWGGSRAAATAQLDSLLLSTGEQCLFTPRSTFSDVSAARRVGSCPKGRKSLTSCLEAPWRALGHFACLAAPHPPLIDPNAQHSNAAAAVGTALTLPKTTKLQSPTSSLPSPPSSWPSHAWAPPCLCGDPSSKGRSIQNRFLERLVRGAESSDVIPESGNSSSSSSTSNIASGTVPTRNSSMLWTGAIAPLWAQKAAAAVLMEAAREELEKDKAASRLMTKTTRAKPGGSSLLGCPLKLRCEHYVATSGAFGVSPADLGLSEECL